MGIPFIIVFFAASSYALVSLVRRLRRERARAQWWVGIALLSVIGIAVGIWCAFHFEYHLSARYRVGSFPLPVVFFHLEDGRWVDFPVPEIQASAAAITNVITITALATLPILAFSRRQHRHQRTTV
jgi:hypothetical protein